MRQGERTVSEFFTEMQIFWDELEELTPTPDCPCEVRCTCALIKNDQKRNDYEHPICFLKGLGDLYSTVKTQILMMDPLPHIDKVYSMVLQQERQLTGESITESKVFFNSSQNQNNWKQQGRNNGNGKGKGKGKSYQGRNNNGKQCTYCNKMGHTSDKHGFPPSYKPKNSNHSVNCTVSDDSSDSLAIEKCLALTSQKDTNSVQQFSPEQLQQLLTLLQQQSKPQPHLVSQIQTSFVRESSTQQHGPNSGCNLFEDDWAC